MTFQCTLQIILQKLSKLTNTEIGRSSNKEPKKVFPDTSVNSVIGLLVTSVSSRGDTGKY